MRASFLARCPPPSRIPPASPRSRSLALTLSTSLRRFTARCSVCSRRMDTRTNRMGASITYVRRIFGVFLAPPPPSFAFPVLIVRKIDRFFDPYPFSVRTYFMEAPYTDSQHTTNLKLLPPPSSVHSASSFSLFLILPRRSVQ